mgnify:CR=1 FL=1
MRPLEGKTALITGAASGIGAAAVERFIAEAVAKGLAIGTAVPVGLEITDIDGLPAQDSTQITYQNTAPTADAHDWHRRIRGHRHRW